MSEEIFDVVNDRDEVIGRKPRREVHRLGLKHRAVHVLVYNAAGALFLQKRSMKKDMHPGTWDSSSSGHVDSGEEYDDCAVRELREEIGLHVEKAPDRWFKIDACEATGQEFCWIYRMESDGPFVLDPEELSDGRFFDLRAIDQWVQEKPHEFADAFLLIWEKISNWQQSEEQ